ncbi:MAG TPA: DNA-binding protein [Prolixibacteraceae bacterium]|nr:DNA-binding protein [Prolixibacteraceae bacterium]
MEMINKNDSSDHSGSRFNQDIHSKVIRAGKRTYFFDVKSTRQDELYLTITESKRRFESDGAPVFDKHKIFLYREDFDKFLESLKEIMEYIQESQPGTEETDEAGETEGLVDVQFEDLSL